MVRSMQFASETAVLSKANAKKKRSLKVSEMFYIVVHLNTKTLTGCY
jgi:hypothetical protein